MNQNTKLALIFVGGLAAGAAVGYLTTRRQIEAKYTALVEEEIAMVKNQYRILRKEGEYSSPEKLSEKYVGEKVYSEEEIEADSQDGVENARIDYSKIISSNNYANSEVESGAVEHTKGEIETDEVMMPVEKNIFDLEGEDPGEAIDPLDRGSRKADKPYVISVEEYMEEAEDFDKVTYTYYDGDDTLADERDSIIRDVDEYVGFSNLSKFGVESDNEAIVYVRNEKLQVDFEILRSEMTYSEQVMGIRPTDPHYIKGNPRKMRMEDDD